MAANAQPSGDGVSLRTVDFSDNPAVMQVSTTLRRLWLVDPSSLRIGNPESEPQEQSLEKAFREVTFKIGNWIAQTPRAGNDRWLDEVWRADTDLTLLDPPEGSQTEIDDSEPGQGPIFTPFRRQVYGIYNHVFWDVYLSLKNATEEKIGEFDPPNTTVMVLGLSDGGSEAVPHVFSTDTFVYPVWIAPGTTLTFSVGGQEKTLTPEGHTWRFSLWFRAGRLVTITPKDETGERAGRVVAVLVLGQCEARPPPPGALDGLTIGHGGQDASDAGAWRPQSDGDEANPNVPVVWPEADHLARAIFLQAGGAVDRCGFDEKFTVEGEDRPEDQLAKLRLDSQPDDSSLYSPLPDNNSIRILVVEPALAKDEPLRTRLVVVSLDDKPSYEAISYTWGDPADKTLLQCNSAQVPIPRNLENALKQLRHSNQPRFVWADSVCINQEDIPERGQQVSIMRHIYQKAERVLVWLGLDEQNQANTAFTAVCDIVRAWRPAGDRLGFSGYAGLLEPMGEDGLARVRGAVDQKAWEALRALFEVGYFRRFWIIQELALGSSAVVFWGRHRIAWGLIGICAAWMMSSGWTFRHGEPITAAYNAFLIYVLPLAKRSGISAFSKLDLSLVLGSTMGRFDSTDARDRIYALLGMPFAGNDPEGQPLLQPDYSRDVRSVYTQAARRILEQDRHLRVLSAVQHGADDIDPSYPSWVPRWDQPPSAEPLALRDEHGYYANGGELFRPSSPSTFTADDESLLTLTGLVCSTSPPNPNPTNLTTPLLTALNSETDQFRASWSATLERFTLFGFRDPAVQAEVFGRKEAMTVSICAQPGKYGTPRVAGEVLDGERAQGDHLGEFLLYWRERASWREGELDGLVGLGPAATREGDVVVVLFGGVVPFVLRPAERADGRRGWRLVGECFVPGLMQGEAVERAGLLADGTFERGETGSLRLTPTPQGVPDPRLERKVGEHGVVAFEIW
ncbi:HET-domain-containing protein [Parathielavia hyrcaniae]|uniref:HET-domain-containing protein n=1 Tax=Parathielavia hyrcaniae TaxID=113614 RepID=A0AAN6T1C7_9PEZI|nr:HET-domain-containing protein [Parathielavia hyrcaniae]